MCVKYKVILKTIQVSKCKGDTPAELGGRQVKVNQFITKAQYRGDISVDSSKRQVKGSQVSTIAYFRGNTSAELLYDKRFRIAANSAIKDDKLKLPTDTEHHPQDYTIIYGIICRISDDQAANLPLFSKITLKVFLDNLSRMQYHVKLLLIADR